MGLWRLGFGEGVVRGFEMVWGGLRASARDFQARETLAGTESIRTSIRSAVRDWYVVWEVLTEWKVN